MALLDTLSTVQQYLAVILLIVAGYFWYQLRIMLDEKKLVFKSLKTYQVSVLMVLPFLIGAMTFLPGEWNVLIRTVFFFLVSIVLAVVAIRQYKANFATLKDDLKTAFTGARGQPLRVAYIEEIVQPEYQKLKLKTVEIAQLEKALHLREQSVAKKEKDIDVQLTKHAEETKRLQEKEQQLKQMERDLHENSKAIDERHSDVEKLRASFEKEKQDVETLKQKLKDKSAAYSGEIDTLVKKERERYDRELAAVKKRLGGQHQTSMQKLKHWEEELEQLEKQLSEKRRDFDDREDRVAVRESQIDKRVRELDKKIEVTSELKAEAAAQKKHLDTLEKEVRSKQSDLAEEKSLLEKNADSLRKQEVKLVRMEDALSARDQALRSKEEDLTRKQRDVERELGSLEQRKVQLQRQAASLVLERGELEAKSEDVREKSGRSFKL